MREGATREKINHPFLGFDLPGVPRHPSLQHGRLCLRVAHHLHSTPSGIQGGGVIIAWLLQLGILVGDSWRNSFWLSKLFLT